MSSSDSSSATGLDSPWILRPSPNPRARLRLFCLPHAGGDTWIYRDWQSELPSFVELCAIRLPGRGSRMAEPAITTFGALVRIVSSTLSAALDLPCAFYGNSMGALIAFELARNLSIVAGVSPALLCVGACRAPQLVHFPSLSGLGSDLLLAELQRRFGKATTALGQSEELMQLNIPIMRADLQLCESYRYRGRPDLNCPITAYRGVQDAGLDAETVDAWAVQTSGAFVHRTIAGDHFFVVGAKAALLRALSQDLESVMA